MINSRGLIIIGFLFLIFLLIVAKLFTIQISKHEYFTLIADRQQNKPQIVKAERGTIKDVNGEVLCFTRDDVSFFIDKRMMNPQRIDSITSIFSKVFNNTKEYYKKIIDEGSGNICLEKKVPMNKAIELKKFVTDGYFSQEDYTRIYPYNNLASHVLGYVNHDEEGIEGLEKVYQEELTGNNGYYVFERDVIGRILSIDENLSKAPVTGNTLNLTLNKTYQQILEEELNAGLKKYDGESAVGIIMNPNSGEILALSNLPDFDPANYETSAADSRRNRAIIDTYEPGSTMKSISMSVLIDQNLVKENDVIDTENGKFIFKGTRISDSHREGLLTVRGIFEQSSNIGMAKLSTRINDDVFYKYLRDFGFSNTTSINLPGEAPGQLKKPSSFTPITKAFMSFGYEIAVTPLQMISAYSAIINGGSLYQPYIVKSITDHFGNIVIENKPKKIRTVINKSTSDLMKDFMIGVVQRGTGTSARLDNVLIGGKTGTSQRLVNKSYSASSHNSSFIGFFPADNPKVICYILINAPKLGQYGGLVAAPVFHDVVKRIIETDRNLIIDNKKIENKENLINDLVIDIKSSSKNNTNEKVFSNIGTKDPEIRSRNISIVNKSIMPNLAGQSMRDAIALLNQLGLEYKIVGNGRVASQSIGAGSPIIPGATCLLKCESKHVTITQVK
jgi:cell division protein FtsI (penicillin-binding protein 3)